MSDSVEISERVQTGLINNVHRTWIEFVVGTASSGDIVVFTPTREELERGEGELAVEHLRREAAAFTERLVDTRNAFRTARGGLDLEPFWAPLMRHVHVEGELVAPAPSLERVIVIIALGAALGIAGYTVSGPWSAWTGPLSAVIVLYALLGLALTSHADRQFAEGAGLAVPIRRGRPVISAVTRGASFSGPYDVIPQIAVDRTEGVLELIPFVEVVDSRGRAVRLITPDEASLSHDPADLASVLLRQADAFVQDLEINEHSAHRLASGKQDSQQ